MASIPIQLINERYLADRLLQHLIRK